MFEEAPKPKQSISLFKIVIIVTLTGLIAGGALVGRQVMLASQLRAAMTDIVEIQHAAEAFKEKYHGIPGDLANATEFWGVDAAGCPDTPPGQSFRTKTCNGNGDGTISDSQDNASYMCEQFRFWQQLSNAGLYQGNYTGTGYEEVCSSQKVAANVNVPASAIKGSAYMAHYIGESDMIEAGMRGVVPAPDLNRNFIIHAGISGHDWWGRPVLTPANAMYIDAKMDDGMPATGHILSFQLMAGSAAASACVAGTPGPEAEYRSQGDALSCSLAFAATF